MTKKPTVRFTVGDAHNYNTICTYPHTDTFIHRMKLANISMLHGNF